MIEESHLESVLGSLRGSGTIYTGSSRLWDAPHMALVNAITGDLPATGRSLYDPASLTPSERRKLSDRMGLERGPLAWLVEVTTNPMVLLGFSLAVMHKMPTAPEMSRYVEGVSKSVRPLLPMLDRMLPFGQVFKGTPLEEMMYELNWRRSEVFTPLWNDLRNSLDKFQKATGRYQLSQSEAKGVAAVLGGIDRPDSRTWQGLRRMIWDDGRSVLGYSGADAHRLLAKLDSPVSVEMSPALRELATEWRGILDRGYDRVLKGREGSKSIQRAMEGMLKKSGAEIPDVIKYERDYWPQLHILSEDEYSHKVLEFIESEKTIARKSRFMAGRVGTKHAIKRAGLMTPDLVDLADLGVDRDILEAVARQQALYEVPGFSLNASEVMPRYIDSLSRVYAWTVPPASTTTGLGERMLAETQKLAAGSTRDRFLAKQMYELYMPMALGGMTPRQAGYAMAWNGARTHVLDSLTEGTLSKVLPTPVKKFLAGSLVSDPTTGYRATGEAVSNYFYLAALGANSLAAAKNLTQILHLVGYVDDRDIASGVSTVFRNGGNYVRARVKGANPTEAVALAFPEFHGLHLELDPMARKAVMDMFETTYERALQMPGAAQSIWTKARELMMLPFSETELFNRLVAFYSARSKGMRELRGQRWYDAALGKTMDLPESGPALETAANKFARNIMFRTQYGAGPLQKPMFMADWWSPMSQFAQYPVRTAGEVYEHLERGLRQGNWAGVGRTLLGSGLVYSAVRETTGENWGDTLLFGGVPTPEAEGAFAPAPFVPPILGTAGAAALALAKNDSEVLRKELPIMVPGGVALARALTSLGAVPGIGSAAGGAAQAIGRPYADYRGRLPDGRIPLYSRNGSLIAYVTPGQLAARAFGWDSATSQQEAEAMKMLLSAREQSSNMRKEMMSALYENDAEKVLRLREAYERRWPGAGSSPVETQDIRSLHLRRNVSRVERTLDTLPPEIRSQYMAAVATTLGPHMPELLGLWGSDLSVGQTVGQRESVRERPLAETRARVGQTLHAVKMRDRLRMSGMNLPEGNASTVGQMPSFGEFGDF